MELISFKQWLESSPLTRARDGWARYGNYPPRADVMSHSTPAPFIVAKAKKEPWVKGKGSLKESNISPEGAEFLATMQQRAQTDRRYAADLWTDRDAMQQAAAYDPKYAEYLATMKAYNHNPKDYATWKSWQDYHAKRSGI